MSDYGADPDPSIPAAQDLAFTKGFLPLRKVNVMQWTYPDDITVRKLAHRETGSNVLFKLGPAVPPPEPPPPFDPVPAGDACDRCWGNGKPFGVGETPEMIGIVIEGVEKGPDWMAGDGEPPNGAFELTQNPGIPCFFRFINASFNVDFRFRAASTRFVIDNLPAVERSFLSIGTLCDTTLENTITGHFIGGTATIFIPEILP